ncbi:hypothetical protein RhiXN_06264 [Rhizoctonia solani]|uniref:Uncharacterized protein n=1 Tax=Rhizoctonia solani TaxID=456999 RepID=A0A8H8NXM8_9AGAM|nr:uncharacterized protein RhiXN_06264 [Rhizoctonia solani]QRW21275.1 hypothetical protein RhiXN_06264 [Rhizoctonia solani]
MASYHQFPPVSAAFRLSSASFLEGVLSDMDGTPAYSLFTARGVTTLSRVGPNLTRTQTSQIFWPREPRDQERAKEAGETVVATPNGKMLMDDVLRPSGSGRSRKMTVPGSSVYLRWKYDSSGHAWHCTSPSRAAIATLRLVPGKPGTTLHIHTTSIPASYHPYQHGYDSDTSEASPNPHAAQNLFDALVLASVLLSTHPDAWRSRLTRTSNERPLPAPPVSGSPQLSAYERTIGKSPTSRPSSSSSSSYAGTDLPPQYSPRGWPSPSSSCKL